MRRIRRCKTCDSWSLIACDCDEANDDLFYWRCDYEGLCKEYSDRNGGSFACIDYQPREKTRRKKA